MIGDKLKELRAKKGYTVQQLCTELKMNKSTYAKYERNERDVSTDTLVSIADYYGVTTDYLLGHAPEQNLFKKLGLKEMTDEEMFAAFESFPAEIRALILAIVKELADTHKVDSSHRKRHQATIGELQEAQAQEEQAQKDAS